MPRHLQADVADRIRATLAAQGRTQADLAAKLGRHEAWLSRRLSGQIQLRLDDLAALAAALDVTPVSLMPP